MFVLFIFLLHSASVKAVPITTLLDKMAAASRPALYFLSYPRSGNTWMRYCIEFLTERPTVHFCNTSNLSNLPLGLSAKLPLNFNKKPILKAHTENELDYLGKKHNPRKDTLIIMVRNPKEAIVRQATASVLKKAMHGKFHAVINNYFDVLRVFEHWHPQKRLLLYYEDLMENPAQVLEKLLTFLGDSPHKLEMLLSELDRHKQCSLQLYSYNGKSISGGRDALFHSRKLDSATRQDIDRWIAAQYPKLWSKYLKDRYAENVLCYE